MTWAKNKALDFDLLEQVGLIGEGERGKYSMLRDRYTIPIYDKMSRIIGFTARTMSDNKDICKYLNLKTALSITRTLPFLVSTSHRSRRGFKISSTSLRVALTSSNCSLLAS